MTDTQKFEITNCMYSRAQIKANKQRIFSNLTHNKNRHSCVHWIANVARQRLRRILTPKLSPVSKQVSGVSSTERKRRVQLVFAYPFHFNKSGFSAYFSRQIRISGFYPDFLCWSVYALFSSKWHRRCRPTDENKNAVMSKRLRDGIMCFRLKIHSRWMMKTHWRAGSWSWSRLGLLFE